MRCGEVKSSGFDVRRPADRVEKSARRTFAVRSRDLNFQIIVLRLTERVEQFLNVLQSEFHRQNFVAER